MSPSGRLGQFANQRQRLAGEEGGLSDLFLFSLRGRDRGDAKGKQDGSLRMEDERENDQVLTLPIKHREVVGPSSGYTHRWVGSQNDGCFR